MSALGRRVGRLVGNVGRFAEIRLERMLVGQPRYVPVGWSAVIADLQRVLGVDVAAILDESALARIEDHVSKRATELGRAAVSKLQFNADTSLARILYALCRAVAPATVVETGVAYGVTSAFILQALAVNGSGTLDSVDAPPPDMPLAMVGALIPADLRGRWRLHVGTSGRVLPHLLSTLGRVDVFLHDSRHSYRVVRWELEAVRPFLRPGAPVVVDDVHKNRGFQRWTERWPPAFSAVVAQGDKRGMFGIALMDASAERR